jgi:hypothetical protein
MRITAQTGIAMTAMTMATIINVCISNMVSLSHAYGDVSHLVASRTWNVS